MVSEEREADDGEQKKTKKEIEDASGHKGGRRCKWPHCLLSGYRRNEAGLWCTILSRLGKELHGLAFVSIYQSCMLTPPPPKKKPIRGPMFDWPWMVPENNC